MDESQSMDAQLMTEATPPLPTEVDGCALGCFIAVCHRLILSLGCLTWKRLTCRAPWSLRASMGVVVDNEAFCEQALTCCFVW